MHVTLLSVAAPQGASTCTYISVNVLILTSPVYNVGIGTNLHIHFPRSMEKGLDETVHSLKTKA